MLYFIMKILNKEKLQQFSVNHSSDLNFKHFVNLYEKCTAKPCPFLGIDATLASDGPSPFRKNLLERI